MINYLRNLRDNMNNKIIYLCIPYSWNPNKSFEIANKITAKLMQEGNIVFSPVSHSHSISLEMQDYLQTNHDFWMTQDIPMLKKCNELLVVIIGEEGNKLVSNSKGCQSEINAANALNMPIKYIEYYE